MFIGHPEAGERSAVIYTLLGSCRRLGINPFDYLKDLFTRLPAAKITQIKQSTPAMWVRARTGASLPAEPTCRKMAINNCPPPFNSILMGCQKLRP